MTLGVATARAQSRSITLAWDPSPDSSVAGYVVYIGAAPGVYSETHDVGNRTSVSLQASTSPTYFAVAAYLDGPLIGQRSPDLSSADRGSQSGGPAAALAACTAEAFLAGACQRGRSPSPDAVSKGEFAVARSGVAPATSGARTTSLRADAAEGGARSVQGARDVACSTLDPVDCLVLEPRPFDGSPRGLAPLPDGRLFVVDGGNQVRVANLSGEVLPDPALVLPESDLGIAGIVTDPDGATSHLVYLATVAQDRGDRLLTIARYREVANRLGEGSVLVTDLPLPLAGDAPLAIDTDGHLYIAMPAAEGRDPYESMILRFNADGTTPHGNVGMSPVFARGIAAPVSIAWDGEGQALRITGRDAAGVAVLGRLALRQGPEGTLREPEYRALVPAAAGDLPALPAQDLSYGNARRPESAPTIPAARRQSLLAVGNTVYRVGATGDPFAVLATYDFTAVGEISAITLTPSGTVVAILTAPSGVRQLVTLRTFAN